MTPAHRSLPQSFRYERTDIPVGITLAEYRRARAPRRPPRARRRLRSALRLVRR